PARGRGAAGRSLAPEARRRRDSRLPRLPLLAARRLGTAPVGAPKRVDSTLRSLRSLRCRLPNPGSTPRSAPSGRCAVVSLIPGRLHAPLPPVAALSSPYFVQVVGAFPLIPTCTNAAYAFCPGVLRWKPSATNQSSWQPE